ncbi:MAG TPA: PAS domain S-box protein, partial [Anaeromyxobacter sp.]
MRTPIEAASPNARTPARPSRAAPLALFLLVAIAIASAAAFSYGVGAADLRQQEERDLATIALLKVREIARWRDERLSDAQAVAVDLAAELAEGTSVKRAVGHWHEALKSHREYRAIAFVSPDGEPRVASGALIAEFGDASMAAFTRRAAIELRASLTPVHRHAGDPELHLNAVAPVVGPGGAVLGVVILRVNPHRQFFAMVQAWPRPSDTAETLLVSPEGGGAVVVNELGGGGAMTIHVPRADAEDPAIQAVSGVRGVVEGRDHRGHRVLAAIAPVPDSAWTLVAKVDRREALAPLQTLQLWTGAVATALMLAAGAGVALWWRTQVEVLLRSRAAADAERRLLARKLENLARYGTDIVILADAESRIVDANDRTIEVFGYARDELLGMPVRTLRDPETVGDFEARVKEQVERGAAMFETRYRRKDGSTFPAEVSVHVDESEGRRYFQAIIRDVTARERAAEALRASEAKFRAAFEFASLGILIVSPDGRVVETNRALRRMLGYGEEEMRGLSLADVHEPGDEVAQSILQQMVQGTRETVEMPRRYMRKDGSVVETILRASALRDDAGVCRFALGVVEDVSDKKRLEAQLVLADRMASIGTLAAGVAHEINNPLAFILSNLDYALGEVRQAGADPEVVRALQDAMDGAVRVREIVRD